MLRTYKMVTKDATVDMSIEGFGAAQHAINNGGERCFEEVMDAILVSAMVTVQTGFRSGLAEIIRTGNLTEGYTRHRESQEATFCGTTVRVGFAMDIRVTIDPMPLRMLTIGLVNTVSFNATALLNNPTAENEAEPAAAIATDTEVLALEDGLPDLRVGMYL